MVLEADARLLADGSSSLWRNSRLSLDVALFEISGLPRTLRPH